MKKMKKIILLIAIVMFSCNKEEIKPLSAPVVHNTKMLLQQAPEITQLTGDIHFQGQSKYVYINWSCTDYDWFEIWYNNNSEYYTTNVCSFIKTVPPNFKTAVFTIYNNIEGMEKSNPVSIVISKN
jgi:hypothetical protein